MSTPRSIRWIWILGIEITICLIAGIIAASAFAAQVTLAWDPNTEVDLGGYRIHYGTASGSYSVHTDVRNVTTYTVTGLVEGQTYYFAATAYDTSGTESGYSNQVRYSVPGTNGALSAPDTDGDGVPDTQDAFPNDPREWADANRNGIGDNADAASGQGSIAPDAPLLTAPVRDSVVSTMAELKTGPFNSSVGGTTHAQTRWQVFRDEDNVCLLDILSTTALTSFTVPKLVLDEGTPFSWRAQFVDSNGAASGWSGYEYFSTQATEADLNANGIPDAQEVSATADLNKDGVPDNQQTAVKSVKMEGTTAQTGISIQETPTALAIESVESEDPRQPDLYANNKPQNMPFGILNIKIAVAKPGDQTVLKLHFFEPVPANGKWYEYDKTAEKWIDFSAYTEFAPDRMSAYVTLRDGGAGDTDGVANGIIIDPGGVGVADAGTISRSADQGGSGGGAGCFIGTVNDPGMFESMLNALCLLGFLSSLLSLLRIKNRGFSTWLK
jgi:chitinase